MNKDISFRPTRGILGGIWNFPSLPSPKQLLIGFPSNNQIALVLLVCNGIPATCFPGTSLVVHICSHFVLPLSRLLTCMLSAEFTILFLLSVLECLRIKSRLKWYIDIRQIHLSLFLEFSGLFNHFCLCTWHLVRLGGKMLRRLCLCSWVLILVAWVELTGCFGIREALIEVCSEFPEGTKCCSLHREASQRKLLEREDVWTRS